MMERLFSPCSRLHDLLESEGLLEQLRNDDPEPLQELNLNVSTEEFLSAERAFTFADLYALLRNRKTVAWVTPPHTGVAREYGRALTASNQLDGFHRLYFSADGKDIIAFARSSEHLSEISDVVLRLLAVSVVQSLLIRLTSWTSPGLFIKAPTLEYLMEQCQSLKVLSLLDLEMDEDHSRVLGAYSRPDLKLELIRCKLTSAGASALAEVLGRNQGPTKLDWCEIDILVLADGLRGNSRLKSLRPRFSGNLEVRDREVLAIAGALRENQGLVDLDLSHGVVVNDEAWGAVCDSLETNRTLQILNLRTPVGMAPAVIKFRMQVLLNMIKVNTTIHTIHLNSYDSRHEIFRKSVIPYLETNRLRPRVRAIQKTRSILHRAKVLGRALVSARSDANMFWMLLSGNAEVSFPSGIAVAANLPDTASTAAATSTANVAVVTASVMSSFTTTTTGTSAVTSSTASASDACAPAAAAAAAEAENIATPFAGQKRKPCHQNPTMD
jgi:hypothetical protein